MRRAPCTAPAVLARPGHLGGGLSTAARRPARRPSSCPTARPADPPQPVFSIKVRQERGLPCLQVTGELDLATAPLLTAMLEHARQSPGPDVRPDGSQAGDHVLVDLSRVTFADSCGLAPVLDSCTTVVAASAPVVRVLRFLDA